MKGHWLTRLQSHIAAGRIAAEAESAETLSWLLKLEPEQRWCLTLNRDACLARLSAADYRRLLALMVEYEPAALMAAPMPPQPCLANLPQLPAPASNPKRRRAPWLMVSLILLLATAIPLHWERAVRAWEQLNLSMPTATGAPHAGGLDPLLAARLQQTLAMQQVIDTLQQQFGAQAAVQETLTGLQQDLATRKAQLAQDVYAGRLHMEVYHQRLRELEQVRTQSDQALTASQAMREQLAVLTRKLWSDWLEALRASHTQP